MIALSFVLQIVALVLLLLAGLGVALPRVTAGWLGMFFWLLSAMLGGVVLHQVGGP